MTDAVGGGRRRLVSPAASPSFISVGRRKHKPSISHSSNNSTSNKYHHPPSPKRVKGPSSRAAHADPSPSRVVTTTPLPNEVEISVNHQWPASAVSSHQHLAQPPMIPDVPAIPAPSPYLLAEHLEFFENPIELREPTYGVIGIPAYYRIYFDKTLQTRGQSVCMHIANT